ncbi:Os02g0756401 [Oryza sativa Japonica Group]|uniref:Os02g0756401 protein n=1 Tax=Oryza sativa subsp. japonica TaxID=39947 RepID=A0A0P0VPZ8_ORYSJ|nr:Os02g0756401 [Oryza sativa Japonica Group]
MPKASFLEADRLTPDLTGPNQSSTLTFVSLLPAWLVSRRPNTEIFVQAQEQSDRDHHKNTLEKWEKNSQNHNSVER